MNAIILAAGKGERLRPLTKNKPKCLMELFGKSLLQRQIELYQKLGITDIVVVTGFKSEQIEFPNISIIKNSKYDTTNMLETLFCAEHKISDSTIVSYGDIIFQQNVLELLIDSKDDISLIVDLNWKNYWEQRFVDPLSDAESLVINDGYVSEIGQKVNSYEKICGQYIGLMKFQNSGISQIKEYYHYAKENSKNNNNILNKSIPFMQSYLTDFLNSIIATGIKIKALPIKNGWLEVDTLDDLKLYESLKESGKINVFFNENS